MTSVDVLSQALRLRSGLEIRNRIAKAATSENLAVKGVPSERHGRLYERWGAGGAGLIITGNVIVDRVGLELVGNVVLESDVHLAALTAWASAAQKSGARLFMQVNHAGRQAPKAATKTPVAPSAVTLEKMGVFGKPRALEDAEITALIERFAGAAEIAKRAGFSGVELHAAHGYLVSQFLSPRTNQRTDRWGGSLENRMRFLLEIVRGMRGRVGREFSLAVKLNSADFQRGGFTEEESMAVVQALDAEGVDLIEVSGGNYEAPAMVGPRASTRAREAYFLEYAEKVRKLVKTPLLVTGGFRTADAMAEAVRSGAIDLAGMARPLCLEPDLPKRILAGTATGARRVDLRMRGGTRTMNDAVQTFWYSRQLRRTAEGKEPDPGLSPWWTFVVETFRNYV